MSRQHSVIHPVAFLADPGNRVKFLITGYIGILAGMGRQDTRYGAGLPTGFIRPPRASRLTRTFAGPHRGPALLRHPSPINRTGSWRPLPTVRYKY